MMSAEINDKKNGDDWVVPVFHLSIATIHSGSGVFIFLFIAIVSMIP